MRFCQKERAGWREETGAGGRDRAVLEYLAAAASERPGQHGRVAGNAPQPSWWFTEERRARGWGVVVSRESRCGRDEGSEAV